MILSEDTIQEVVSKELTTYLETNALTFSDLKSHLISKIPIPIVQAKLAAALTDCKHTEQIKIQKNIENQTTNTQLIQDTKQEKKDASSEAHDQRTKTRLLRELNHIPTLTSTYQTEHNLLKRKLARLQETAPTLQHDKFPSFPAEDHGREIAQSKEALLMYELKIQELAQKHNTIQKKLQKIEASSLDRQKRSEQRRLREQARLIYQNTGENVALTLSPEHQVALKNNIKEQFKLLENKYEHLLKETEQTNYALFLNVLESYLNKPNIRLKPLEIDALKMILKLMSQHLQFEEQAIGLKNNLQIKRQSYDSELIKFKGLKAKVKSVQTNNPHLESENSRLRAMNNNLYHSLSDSTALAQKLGIPTLLLLALTFIFSIPFILTLGNIIPLFVAPALLYSLVSIPPALLLLATLALGIAALVYLSKSYSDKQLIKSNLHTIETNTYQMSHNDQSISNLTALTLPALEAKIEKDKVLIDNLVVSIKNLQTQASHALKQARGIKPISFSSGLFATKEITQEQQATPTTELCSMENATGLA